jgi:hypothetical protein
VREPATRDTVQLPLPICRLAEREGGRGPDLENGFHTTPHTVGGVPCDALNPPTSAWTRIPPADPGSLDNSQNS